MAEDCLVLWELGDATARGPECVRFVQAEHATAVESSDPFRRYGNTSVDSDPHGNAQRVTLFVEKSSRRRRGRNAASGNHLDPA